MEGRVNLRKAQFSASVRPILETGDLRASTFLFSTGVEGVRIESPRGYIVVLPYQGQQIWEAHFGGRPLQMKSFFSEPVRSPNLFDSYGAFLYHCGALRMGTPGPEDDHPVHGELPAAPYQEAWLCFGEEEGEPYIGISGSFTYIRAFGDKYRAVPLVKLYARRGVVDVSMTIENLAHYPMDLMYMCHINFLPEDNGEIIQATGWSTSDMVVRSQIPGHVHPTKTYLQFLDKLKKNPEVTRVLRPEDEYNPEVVFYVENLRHDAKGMTHMIQKHVDGTSDYVSYDVRQLNHTVRWMLKHRDQQVIGMALPSTCEPEGYTAEKKKGNVRSLPGQEKVTFSVKTGFLDGGETTSMEKTIRSL